MIAQLAVTLLTAAALPFATAQEHSDCNPLQTTCPANPALGAGLTTTFAGTSSMPAGWSAVSAPGAIAYGASGMQFVIGKQGDNPTIQTDGYFFFGYAEVKMQAAAGQGIVSSIVLQSDDLDEVDWEFTGTDTTQTQTNYFGKGITGAYDRAAWFPVSAPQSGMHTYAVNWTSSSLTWLIDGDAVRTLNYNDAAGGNQFPQTPMRLKIGIWAGGDPSNGAGTIEWAGGATNYANVPFTMTVESVKVINYSPGSSYTWADHSGSFGSVQVAGGSVGSNVGGAAAVAPASPSMTTMTIQPSPVVGGSSATGVAHDVPLLTDNSPFTPSNGTMTNGTHTGMNMTTSANATSSGMRATTSASAKSGAMKSMSALGMSSTLAIGVVAVLFL